MGAWTFPSFIYKDKKAEDLDNSMLVYYHENMHVLWGKILGGYPTGWTFEETYNMHKNIVAQMAKMKIIHIEPINSLDTVNVKEEVKNPEEITAVMSEDEKKNLK